MRTLFSLVLSLFLLSLVLKMYQHQRIANLLRSHQMLVTEQMQLEQECRRLRAQYYAAYNSHELYQRARVSGLQPLVAHQVIPLKAALAASEDA